MASLYFVLNTLIFFMVTGLVSYGDIFQRKMLNRWIALGAKYGLSLFLIFLALSGLAQANLLSGKLTFFRMGFFVDVAYNLLCSFLVAVLFWYASIWAAGDAKLFTLAAFLIPLTFYAGAHLKYFPSFILLLNVFIPVLIYVFGKFLLYLIGETLGAIQDFPRKYQQYRKMLQEHWLAWSYRFLGIQTMFLFIGFMQMIVAQLLGRFIPFQGIFFLLFLFGRKLFISTFENKAVRSGFVISFVFLMVLGVFYEPNQVLTLFFSSLKISISLLVIIQLINTLFDSYIEKRETFEVPIEKLEPYALLSTRSEVLLQRDKAHFQTNIKRFYPDGLLPEQIEPIQNWYMNEGIKSIELYKTFPFAPFILLGGLITILSHGSPFVSIAVKLLQGIDAGTGLHILQIFLSK